jgi:prepilin-type processing-associated H-X9-DG protein
MELGTGICKTASIPDGASNTIMVGEKLLNANFIMQPEPNDNEGYVQGWDEDNIRWGSWFPNPNYPNGSSANSIGPPMADFYAGPWGSVIPLMPNDYKFGSAHATGANFVFCDGAVRLIHYRVDPETFRRACCRNDGLTFNTDAL